MALRWNCNNYYRSGYWSVFSRLSVIQYAVDQTMYAKSYRRKHNKVTGVKTKQYIYIYHKVIFGLQEISFSFIHVDSAVTEW